MRNTRIHTSQALAPGAAIRLEAGPTRHLARALRMGVGDALWLFDGRGGEYAATIVALDRQRVQVEVGERLDGTPESPLAVHLGIAVSRGERMDWVVQKATELGVAAISPLLSERTVVKLPAARADKKLQHWRQIAISACEQSGRCRLPLVAPLQHLGDWLPGVTASHKFILHPQHDAAPAAGLTPDSLALLVGPEGGFSPAELDAAAAADFAPLHLGPRILRTETAPLAALAIVQARWGDMG